MPKNSGYIPQGIPALNAYYDTIESALEYGLTKVGSGTPSVGNLQYIKALYSNGYGLDFATPVGPVAPQEVTTGFWTSTTPLVNPYPEYGNVPGWKEAFYWNTQLDIKGRLTAAYVKNSSLLLTRYCRTTVIPFMIARPDIWSDDDLRSFHVRPRRGMHHNPIPAPQIAPTVSLRLGENHEIKVTVTEPNEGGHTKYMVATKGIKGCRINWRFTQNGTPIEGQEEFQEIYTSRLKHIIQFEAEDAGKQVEIRANFTNPTLAIGPPSDSVFGYIT